MACGHMKLAIQTFLRGYPAIVQHLEQLQNRDVAVSRTEKGNKAKHFYRAAVSKDMWLMLHFVLDVLCVLADVSEKFQQRTAVLSDILSEISLAVKNLDKLKTRDGFHLRRAIVDAPSSLMGNDMVFVSARAKFIEAVNDSLQKRFTDNPGILNACSVLSLSTFPASNDEIDDYGDEAIDELTDYFKPALEAAAIDVQKIGPEWTKLKQHITTRFKNPNQTSWEEVNEKLDSVCPNVLGLVDLVLAIPASSADAERGFSQLKNIKTDSRSRLLDTHLSDQMLIMLETPGINNFDPVPAINLWNLAPRVSRRIKQTKETVDPKIRPVVNVEVNQVPAADSAPFNQVPAADSAPLPAETFSLPVETIEITESSQRELSLSTESSQAEVALSTAEEPDASISTFEPDTPVRILEPVPTSKVNLDSAKPLAIESVDKSVQISVDIVDKAIQTGSSAKGLFDEDAEDYQSDDDYDYENSPIGQFELDTKIEYFDRMEMASAAFAELLELESR